ncbi:MAG: arginine repressor [Christensenella sp.]
MKSKRQNKILEIIENNEAQTQEELVLRLNEAGYNVTQATISRDIKELHLIKVQSATGTYKYAVNKKNKGSDMDILMRIFKDTAVSIENAVNIIVIKTLSGSANAAAEVVDSLHYNGVLGTIAGDNTIFVVTSSEHTAEEIVERFSRIINK